MGWLDRLRRTAPPTPTPLPSAVVLTGPASAAPAPTSAGASGQAGFAVIDVETTGLSARAHRVLELAIVRTDTLGRPLGEWTCRFNPGGPVGASHIHGITARDVAGAPPFAQVLPQISALLAGAAIAGHNVAFDLAFLRAEYARAGWALPHLPAACTLEHSWRHLPHLDRRRLSDCCAATGIVHSSAHSALGDARATATLLASYLDPKFGQRACGELTDLPRHGWSVVWPTAPGGVRPPLTDLPPRVQRKIAASKVQAPTLVSLLGQFSLADALDDGAPAGSLPYLELLAEVLEDGVLTDDEQSSLGDLAEVWSMSEQDVAAAHRGLLLALAHLALDDGKVSRAEKAELLSMAELLSVPAAAVTALLDQAEAARQERLSADLMPLPVDWSLGEPLRVGDKVAFTGCDDQTRARLEERAEMLGVRVLNNVSSRTAMLVTDGSFHGGKAEDAAALGTRQVTPEQFATLLKHLQPAPSRRLAVPAQRPQPTTLNAVSEQASPAAPPPAASANVPPAVVRAWAAENGFTVGVRGRLPAEVFEAYRQAHAAPAVRVSD